MRNTCSKRKINKHRMWNKAYHGPSWPCSEERKEIDYYRHKHITVYYLGQINTLEFENQISIYKLEFLLTTLINDFNRRTQLWLYSLNYDIDMVSITAIYYSLVLCTVTAIDSISLNRQHMWKTMRQRDPVAFWITDTTQHINYLFYYSEWQTTINYMF